MRCCARPGRSTSTAREVAATLDGRCADPKRSARFVRAFVRPGPGDVPATVRFVDALETLAARPAPPSQVAPAWTGLIRPMLRPFRDRGGSPCTPTEGRPSPAERRDLGGASTAQASRQTRDTTDAGSVMK